MMKKSIALAAALGAAFCFAPQAAYAGNCEIRHAEQVLNCNGSSACMEQADYEYFLCLKRQIVIYE